jgi:integrase/recombinase XerC
MHAAAVDFLDYLAMNRRMSIHTVSAYENDLQQFHIHCQNEGLTLVTGLNAMTVRGWMAELMQSGLQARTVHRKISVLRSFTRYLRKQGTLRSDPLSKISLPKMPKRIVQDIPARDLQNMFAHFPWQEQENGQRDRLLLLLFYSTGMRLSELAAIHCGDVDLNRKTVQVTGKRNKQRLIPLHDEIMVGLKDWMQGRRGLLFTLENGKPMYRMYIYRLVNQYLRLFSDALKTSPHVLRHSFATHMLNNGAQLMAIKEILGHASLAATQVYTKNSFEKLKKIHGLHPRN